jgi:hypothetical protein
MSALGHEQTSRHVRVMSAIPLKADIHQRGLHVRLVPIADICFAGVATVSSSVCREPSGNTLIAKNHLSAWTVRLIIGGFQAPSSTAWSGQ